MECLGKEAVKGSKSASVGMSVRFPAAKNRALVSKAVASSRTGDRGSAAAAVKIVVLKNFVVIVGQSPGTFGIYVTAKTQFNSSGMR